MDEYIGIIKMFAGNFAPRNWAYCNGQLLPIAQNQSLFSILGTTYGGDGRTTFALPDLRGRVPVNSGGNSAGPGLSAYRLGEKEGNETTTLITKNLPAHNHTALVTGITATAEATVSVPAVADSADTSVPGVGSVFCDSRSNKNGNVVNAYSSEAADTTLKPFTAPVAITATGGDVTVGMTGNNVAFSNIQPSLGLNYIICMEGLYPPRS